jgi:iron-sulfur cluster repair protein YtfE (RIC family)
MKPSEIRSRILAEHDDLRRRLTGLERLAAHFLSERPPGDKALRMAVRELAATLEEHLSMEEELLLPAILDVDCWGPIRAERMMEEHDGQRATINRLNDISRCADLTELARGAQALGKTLLEDMRREESELLHPDLLRDDVIAIAQFVG